MNILRTRLSYCLAAGLLCGLPMAFSSPTLAKNDAARITALKSRIATIAVETQRVEDLTQIHRLQRAYGYYIDKGYWGEAADLFADDATMEIGVDGVYRGKARIREFLIRQGGGNEGPGLPFGQFNHHMQLQPVITVAPDGKTAHGRWRDFALLGQYKKAVQWGDAVMENTYVKEAGVWKIQSLRSYTNFVAPYKGGWAALKPADADWRTDVAKVFPADAAPTTTYKPFPAVFVPPYHYTRSEISTIRSAPPFAKQLARAADAVGELETMADVQERKLAILRSERAIENLQAIYGYYVDKGLWDKASALFAKDGTYEYGQMGVYVGRKRVRQALSIMGPQGLEEGQLNNYPMLQPIISVADDNRTAKARWRSDVQLSRNSAGQWGAGVYENEYVNEGGSWRISKLHYYVTMLTNYDKGWVKEPLPMAGPSQDFPPDRPPTEVYGDFPKMYLVPYHYPHPVTGKPHSVKGN